ncbi:unnamed protein product [Caretta caretta]
MDRVHPAGFPDGAGGGDTALRGAAVHVPPGLDWEHGDPGCCALLTPMHNFPCNFSRLDVLFTSVITLQLLSSLLSGDKSVPFPGCVARCYFFSFLRTVEFFLLTCMTYDRCAAICNLLRYSLLMNGRVCVRVMLACWLGGSQPS